MNLLELSVSKRNTFRLSAFALTCILAVVTGGCSSSIHFEEDETGAAASTPPCTEMITETLISAERRQHWEVANQNLDQLLVPNPPPYTIGPGDVLTIVVWDHPELVNGTTTATATESSNTASPPVGFVVDQLGRIQFPLAGLLTVDGMTEEQAQRLLTTKLAKYLATPSVTLRVEAYRSKRVYIDGDVKQPGLQALNDIPMTLVEALNRAGGMLPTADQSRIVLERAKARYRINLRSLIQEGINPGLIMLAPGDVVRVHSRDESKVFVSGEVITPRALTMHDGRLTLNEALGETGGINPLSGDARQVYVVRKTPERTRVFQLDARKATSLAMAEAFELHPKDIVYVSATSLANWNRIMSLLIPGALTSAVSATDRQ